MNDRLKEILFAPISAGANRLCIISAHAAPDMVSWLLTEYNAEKVKDVKIELIIGTTVSEGLRLQYHEKFKELSQKREDCGANKFSCSYIISGEPFTRNLYIWLHDEQPICAYSGSYEFTQRCFFDELTVIQKCDAKTAYDFYKSASARSSYCYYSEIEDCVRFYNQGINNSSDSHDDTENTVVLSLLIQSGRRTGKRSGLNWGQRGGRNKNEAYIPLSADVARSGFFPLNGQHFMVLTDDNKALILRAEQQNNKALTTPLSNALLGEYFRRRLNMPNGAYINADDLERYGRTDVKFTKIDEELYFMDFSNGRSD